VSGIVTNLWGSILEAWTELRIHRTRVLLSLIGVAVAVTAIATVVGLGQIVEQSQREQQERYGGRPATVSFSAFTADGSPVDPDALNDAFDTVVDRYQVTYSTHNVSFPARVQLPGSGVVEVQGQAVDVSYGTMHRVKLLHGRWFKDSDNDLLAPVVIINEYYWQQLGSPALSSHPTTVLRGENDVTAVIIGVTPSSEYDTYPSMIELYSAFYRTAAPADRLVYPPNFELWVPPELGEQMMPLVKRDVQGMLGSDYQVEAYRQDYEAQMGGEDPFATLKLMVAGGALLVLLLGALGLVNISLVTVRQRIREIGIRRSFGATAWRVFFAVMMESIVATFVAGVVGVVAAILLVQSPLIQNLVGQGVVDLPPFPLEAAVLGIVASVAVGALAGLLPALVAIRVKVIDAIRY
jgi:putative ABC transport system permease protein